MKGIFKLKTIIFLLPFFVSTPNVIAQTATDCPMIGLNLSGGEYSWENFPDTTDINYLRSKGIGLVRLPIAWEKFQPHLNGPLDANQVADIKTFLAAAATRNLKVIVDLHNYVRYDSVWSQATAWNLWSDGYIASPLVFPSSQTYTFIVQAKGDVAGGVWPNMELRIDGIVQGTVIVDSANYDNYSFSSSITSGIHSIEVAFTNNGTVGSEDRNLYVSKVNITGASFSSVLAAANMPIKTTGATIGFRGEGSTESDDSTNVQLIGSAAVPISAYTDLWIKLAIELKGNSAIAGYDIMNEPHDMPDPAVWPAAAQEAVNGIRSVDTTTAIYVEGYEWAGAESWMTYNASLNITDPNNKLVYEAHQYFDNGSGQYTQTYDQVGATDTSGAARVQPFLTWLQQHNFKGYLGEFAVPDDDSRWLPLLDSFLISLKANNVSGTCWGYNFHSTNDPGWWHSHYIIGINPIDNGGSDEPQMAILSQYAVDSMCTITTEIKKEIALEISVKMYPNPITTTCILRISSNVLIEGAQLKIYDLLGKEVKNSFIINHETTIERGELEAGIYFYTFVNKNNVLHTGKLIVQ